MLNRYGRSVIRAIAVIGAGTALTATLPAQPASAATLRNGICEVGEFCYYWGDNLTGSVSDLPRRLTSYGDSQPSCYDYKSAGSGQGQCIKNNARSFWNRTGYEVVICYNSNFGGSKQFVMPGAAGQLAPQVYRDNASHTSEVG
jgi:hypothetical protein